MDFSSCIGLIDFSNCDFLIVILVTLIYFQSYDFVEFFAGAAVITQSMREARFLDITCRWLAVSLEFFNAQGWFSGNSHGYQHG